MGSNPIKRAGRNNTSQAGLRSVKGSNAPLTERPVLAQSGHSLVHVVHLTTEGAFLAGILVAYGWYLSVHYCAHHNFSILPASLLKHHLDHHKFASRNYVVTTKLWDRVFGTMLQ
jgi:sterol desaturase/sphingolipid hydroxylase (fatty acid hydroxylase superfamily)